MTEQSQVELLEWSVVLHVLYGCKQVKRSCEVLTFKCTFIELAPPVKWKDNSRVPAKFGLRIHKEISHTLVIATDTADMHMSYVVTYIYISYSHWIRKCNAGPPKSHRLRNLFRLDHFLRIMWVSLLGLFNECENPNPYRMKRKQI